MPICQCANVPTNLRYNSTAPAPASALISTGLVNAGFLALLRVYKLLAGTEVFPWVRSVLLIVGILSLGVGALFLRRTNNYKRFLSYSTVENMGIAAIGLGIGGIGVWAALFHVFCHTLIKSSLFLQMAVVRQVYDSYRINRIGDYIRINRVGAVGLLTGMVVLLAFPPSPLFVSELMILKQVITDRNWWLVAGLLLLMCIPALECLKIAEFLAGHPVLVVIVALIDDVLRAELVAHFLLKLVEDIRADRSRVSIPVHELLPLQLVEDQGELVEEGGVADDVDIGGPDITFFIRDF